VQTGGIYKRLGIKTYINAYGTLTILGGPLMPAQVVQAMEEASHNFVKIHDLQDKVEKRLAELIGVEAAFSGGKNLRGPQCAGLLLGRSDLVKKAYANHSPNDHRKSHMTTVTDFPASNPAFVEGRCSDGCLVLLSRLLVLVNAPARSLVTTQLPHPNLTMPSCSLFAKIREKLAPRPTDSSLH